MSIRIRRYNYRQRRALFGVGCLASVAGCIMLVLLGVLLLLPALPSIGMRVMGFSPKGETRALFAEVTAPSPVQLQAPQPVQQAVIILGGSSPQNLPATTYDYTVMVGNGGRTATAAFSESSLMQICQQISPICRGEDSRFRNVRLDLKPGGAVIYADTTLPELPITQTLGIVLRFDTASAQFRVAGVDVGGVLYDAPPNQLGALVGDVERAGNDLLRQLTLQAGGSSYRLTEAQIDEHTLTLILQ